MKNQIVASKKICIDWRCEIKKYLVIKKLWEEKENYHLGITTSIHAFEQ